MVASEVLANRKRAAALEGKVRGAVDAGGCDDGPEEPAALRFQLQECRRVRARVIGLGSVAGIGVASACCSRRTITRNRYDGRRFGGANIPVQVHRERIRGGALAGRNVSARRQAGTQ